MYYLRDAKLSLWLLPDGSYLLPTFPNPVHHDPFRSPSFAFSPPPFSCIRRQPESTFRPWESCKAANVIEIVKGARLRFSSRCSPARSGPSALFVRNRVQINRREPGKNKIDVLSQALVIDHESRSLKRVFSLCRSHTVCVRYGFAVHLHILDIFADARRQLSSAPPPFFFGLRFF